MAKSGMSLSPTSAPDHSISVIICAYTEERWDDLVAAVASVRRQTLAAHEIIVVIDHNPALQARAARACAPSTADAGTQPEVVVIANRFARGLSGARNSGIQAAQGAIIAFMDEDAVAAADWLAHLATAYADAETLGAGGAIIPVWEHGRPAWFPAEFDWVVGCTYRGMPREQAAVRNLIGCNMSFRREIFATVGGFRDGIGRIGTRPLGCEETELCIRVAQEMPPARLLYVPQARVRHHVPAKRARWNYFRSRCYAEGLSKAKIATLVGEQDSLASEWTYTLHTLPLGVLRGIAETLATFKPAGLLRAGAIAAGLMITTAGYLHGKLLVRQSRPTAAGSLESGMLR